MMDCDNLKFLLDWTACILFQNCAFRFEILSGFGFDLDFVQFDLFWNDNVVWNKIEFKK